MKNEDQSMGGRRKPMKIRTIIAATCAQKKPMHRSNSRVTQSTHRPA